MAKRRMADVAPGGTLIVLATDAEAPIDLAAWATEEGYAYDERPKQGFTEFRLTRSG
jgi:TusA-related sulfurtransferase